MCEGAAGACPVGLPIVWLGPQARAQMMMGGRSEQATIQNLYSSEQATIQRYTVWWGVLSRQQYRTYTVWWGVQRRGQRCQERERRVRGFTMLECPPSNPPWATHDNDGDDGYGNHENDSDYDASTNLQTHHDYPPVHLPPFKSQS